MPTHADYPWERDERRREQEARQPRAPLGPPSRPPRRRRRSGSSQGNAPAAALIVGVMAAMLAAAFALHEDPAPVASVTPPVRVQPTVKSTVRGRLERRTRARRRVTWPVTGIESRIARNGIVEVWGGTTAPDGATVRVHASRTRRGRRIPLGEGPVERGHFLVRARVPPSLRGRPIWIGARVG